ncbi:MAG TPA: shikimate kinase [Candidatus Udaeobacter sp.]|jgi:shikimate kinase|nr:shikimate kinase [Candidatus Udaeobacter sp.]
MNRHSRSIVLVGMMGAGKSSVGNCLRRRTRLKLFDTDEIITSKFGMPVSEIFSKNGENKFREAETEALQALATSEPVIIVTGGGIVSREENLDILKRLGVVVWLKADEETLFKRASRGGSRPLLQCKNPKKAFTKMLRARLPLYAKIADIRVDTSVLTDEEVAVAILSKFSRYYCESVPAAAMPAIA